MGRKDMMRTAPMIAVVCAAIGTAGGIAGDSAATNGNDSSGISSGSSTTPLRIATPVTGRDPSQGGHVGQNGSPGRSC